MSYIERCTVSNVHDEGRELDGGITIPTRCANVSPIVPVPQHISNSKVSGPKPAHSPASEYNFSAARVLTCNRVAVANYPDLHQKHFNQKRKELRLKVLT